MNFFAKHTSSSYQVGENPTELMRTKGTPQKTKLKADVVLGPKKRKGKQKPKVNITMSEDTKQKLAALAELEKRSVSNLIEVMTDARWEELADREGIDYAKTVAEIAGLKGLKADNDADRKRFRREILKRVLKFEEHRRR